MEVHAHTHTPRKKWTHYLWEFLMLFLAVFCGFLAENIREHKVERNREKEYIESLIEDIENDVTLIDNQNAFNKEQITKADSLIEMLNNPIAVKTQTKLIYYLARVSHRTIFFTYNDRTIEQLNNSGGFRLIHNQKATNKIVEYYRLVKRIQQLESLTSPESDAYKKTAVRIFDARIFRNMIKDTLVIRTEDSPPLLTADPITLNELCGIMQYQTGTRLQVLSTKERLKTLGVQLINVLKEEYHLK
jgi:hypothetical protein